MTKYISRQDVLDILLKHFGTIDAYEFTKASQEINSLPTIDPISIIDEMIGQYEKQRDSRKDIENYNTLPSYQEACYNIVCLRRLKSRLSLTQK